MSKEQKMEKSDFGMKKILKLYTNFKIAVINMMKDPVGKVENI